jgi:tetratricopeptide (TPR) repeat protein
VSVPDELERARHLAYGADEPAARDLLLALVPEIERADRDDWLLEVFAQLGEIYLSRGALDGARESSRRIVDCLDIYRAILAGTRPDAAALMSLPHSDIEPMIRRYTRFAKALDIGVAAAAGDHDGARAALAGLDDDDRELLVRTQIRCATALADDDLYSRALPLWDHVIMYLEQPGAGLSGDHAFVQSALEYGRFCVETGRLAEAAPWLAKAEARGRARGWALSVARAQLERAAACWSAGDHESTEQLITAAYPVIAEHARAHDVSRCRLYLGLTRLATGLLDEADDHWQHAERHWREIGASLHVHRILLQRSWISIFRGDFETAITMIEAARVILDAAPRRSWLQVARLDSQLGTVWRADALADLGFDASDPEALGVIDEQPGSARYRDAMTKLERAADLKIPAALAADSVRYTITDPAARAHWATRVAAPLLAGAFAVAWEWENTELVSQLIEYHSARGMLSAAELQLGNGEWATAATESVPIDRGDGLIELGPLPTLQMDPGAGAILGRYRALAQQRYGTQVTAQLPGWTTWP